MDEVAGWAEREGWEEEVEAFRQNKRENERRRDFSSEEREGTGSRDLNFCFAAERREKQPTFWGAATQATGAFSSKTGEKQGRAEVLGEKGMAGEADGAEGARGRLQVMGTGREVSWELDEEERREVHV